MVCWDFLLLHFLSLVQALQCFHEAATEVEKEDFLMKLTASEDEDVPPRLQYYNKVGTDRWGMLRLHPLPSRIPADCSKGNPL